MTVHDMTGDALTARIRTALGRFKAVREVRMFGGIGFMLNGNLVAAASQRGLLLRVGADGQKDALKQKGTRPMVMRGRPMKDYVYLDPPALGAAAVDAGLRLALDFVRTLPAKPASSTSAKKATGKSKKRKEK